MFNFKIIKHRDIIILDDGFSNIKFKNFSYEIINLKTINFFCAIKTLFCFFFKKNSFDIKEVYKQNLYRMYSPKLAISHHINKKAVECKYLCPEIRNAVYQFAYFRNKKKLSLNNLLGKFKNKNKNINENLIDYLFVFHEKDKKNLKFKNTKVFVVGSVKNNEIILKKTNKKKSILFISEYNPKFYKQNKLSYKKECKLLKFLGEFCKKNKIKLNIALRSNRKDKNIDKKEEIKFYNKFFGTDFNISSQDAYNFSSKSEVVVCISSNLGIELLARKYKVLFILINESKNEHYPYLPKDEIFVERKFNRNKFLTKLKKIYNLKSSEWELLLKKKIKNIKFEPGNKLLKKKIEEILKNEEQNN